MSPARRKPLMVAVRCRWCGEPLGAKAWRPDEQRFADVLTLPANAPLACERCRARLSRPY